MGQIYREPTIEGEFAALDQRLSNLERLTPLQPRAVFMAYRSAAQKLANANWALIGVDTVNKDPGSHFLSGKGYKVPAEGYYHVDGEVHAKLPASTTLIAAIYVNGVSTVWGNRATSVPEENGSTVSTIVFCKAGDIIELWAYQSSATEPPLSIQGASTNFLSVMAVVEGAVGEKGAAGAEGKEGKAGSGGGAPAGGAENEILVWEASEKAKWSKLTAAIGSIFAVLAGRAGGQELIGGTGATDKLKLVGTSGSAEDIVTFHKKLVGPLLEVEELQFTGSATVPLKGLKALKLSQELFLEPLAGLFLGYVKLAPPATEAHKTNNWAVNIATVGALLAVEPTEAWEISGMESIDAFESERILTLSNQSAFKLTLLHESASSTAVRRFRFSTGANLVLEPGECVILKHGIIGTEAKTRWRDIGGSLSLNRQANVAAAAETLASVTAQLNLLIAACKAKGVIL
jgi:hypothetical protein